jgi:ribosomal protein S18 acetylase RimI-like enzyme
MTLETGLDDVPGGAAAAADVPGLRFRRLRRPADYPAMNAIANDIRRAIGDPFTTSDESFATFYETGGGGRFDPDHDVAIVELEGEIVGYGRTGSRQELDGPFIVEVVPFLPATAGLGAVFAATLSLLEARGRALAATAGAAGVVLETFGGDAAPEREALILAAGYAPVRHGYTMVRPSLDDLPDSPLPEGLEIREVQPEHLRPIWDAAMEAFRDAWGYTEPTEADYERFAAEEAGDTALWRIAWDGDQVAGQVRSFIDAEFNRLSGRKRGYTESISVRRPHRKRGLARALIAASFPLLRERGMTEAALGVDTENVSGALRLYERCGFRPLSRTTTYRKPVA